MSEVEHPLAMLANDSRGVLVTRIGYRRAGYSKAQVMRSVKFKETLLTIFIIKI